MEALTLVESPLPMPAMRAGLRLWFQGMTIFPSATIRRIYSTSCCSLLATVCIWGVVMPWRADSIWVSMEVLLEINSNAIKRK